MRLIRVAAAEDRSCVVKDADLVLFLASSPEIETIGVVHQGENAAADGSSRRTSVASLFPGCMKGANLGGLLNVEGLTGLIPFERGRLHVHAELGGPDGGRIGRRPPPDTIAQSFGVGLHAQQPGWIGKHRARVWLGKALAAQ